MGRVKKKRRVRVLSPREAFRVAKEKAHPELRPLIEKFGEVFTLPKNGEKAEAIVCSPWPIPEPGVMRGTCSKCGRYVALTPDSGLAYHLRWPEIPLLCRGCAYEKVGVPRE